MTADEAWQRSVMLVTETQLVPGAEPRLNEAGGGELPSAKHPFFWSGFLLADLGAKPQDSADEKDPAAEALKGQAGLSAVPQVPAKPQENKAVPGALPGKP